MKNRKKFEKFGYIIEDFRDIGMGLTFMAKPVRKYVTLSANLTLTPISVHLTIEEAQEYVNEFNEVLSEARLIRDYFDYYENSQI